MLKKKTKRVKKMDETQSVKTEGNMHTYFEKLVKKGFRAYDIEFNHKQVIEDTEDYQIIRVEKGAVLKPTKDSYRFFFIEEKVTGQKQHSWLNRLYHLDIRSFDRNVSGCSSFRDLVHACDLERLTEDFNPKKLTLDKRYLPDVFDNSGPYDYVVVPKEMIEARLKVECVQHQNIDLHANFYHSQQTTRTHVTIENGDDKDKVFNNFIKFIQSK